MKKILSVVTTFIIILCGCSDIKTAIDSKVSAQSDAIEISEYYTIEDAIALQDFLLCRSTTGNGKNFDSNHDGIWNIFDLCLMKQEIVKNQMEEHIIYITIGEKKLTADMEKNASADAFLALLQNNPLTINMSDYGNFEKVGSIGTTLPQNNQKITTEPGDIILYQGNSVTIYYDKNTWNFTKLGKIRDITQEELKTILGDGEITVTFSLS